MKKLILFSALALGVATASAQSLTDYYNVSFDGQAVTNGGTICSEHTAATEWYTADVALEPKVALQSASIRILGDYTGDPSKAESEADRDNWGRPSVCYQIIGGSGECPPCYDPSKFADFSLDTTSPFEIQFHLMSEAVEPIGPDFNPADPSTWPQSILPSKAGKYQLTVTGTVNGAKFNDFTFYVILGPNAAGVDSAIDDNDAPAVYFDLSGRRVLNPAKGQFVIERRGMKVTKKVIL